VKSTEDVQIAKAGIEAFYKQNPWSLKKPNSSGWGVGLHPKSASKALGSQAR
jgi:hypothetical protein